MTAALALQACSFGGAPSYIIFGAYFPRWLMAGLVGVAAALVAHRVFVATGWNRKVPLQLSVCSAIGLTVAVLFWALGTR
ncbi:hypothetical protein [Achromobacter marplatensis]|jgi:hypothetical protein|uniref:Uncharacterized protein n=1 Tax=Achromobacter marplatensis TaxID=470868 RepID=A0AA42WAJ3_9BURK|nr:hypothetical protein [Achromobacter marplatensis]EJO29571.1 hypothetical protein QWC_21154 [Achromobacter marplatensis]MDH2051615.1 hypothetical protein [Achromobacter marplatensis]